MKRYPYPVIDVKFTRPNKKILKNIKGGINDAIQYYSINSDGTDLHKYTTDLVSTTGTNYYTNGIPASFIFDAYPNSTKEDIKEAWKNLKKIDKNKYKKKQDDFYKSIGIHLPKDDVNYQYFKPQIDAEILKIEQEKLKIEQEIQRQKDEIIKKKALEEAERQLKKEEREKKK